VSAVGSGTIGSVIARSVLRGCIECPAWGSEDRNRGRLSGRSLRFVKSGGGEAERRWSSEGGALVIATSPR
jgi:hypothetical protein